MKRKLYLLAAIIIAICGNSFSAAAQSPTCKIYYSYDVAGNRVKRLYDCPPPTNPWDNPTYASPLVHNVYPNPTTGPINVEFSAPTATASFLISDMNGAQILQYDLTQLTTIVTFDITPQVPGTYILTVMTTNTVENYPITKL